MLVFPAYFVPGPVCRLLLQLCHPFHAGRKGGMQVNPQAMGGIPQVGNRGQIL